ncbi:MAG TPA: adenylate/guanylate cyclase domain-containing protein [Solimonas sp.]
MAPDSSAFWVLALLAGGIGFIFMWTDWRSPPSRALAMCFILIGGRVALAPYDSVVVTRADWWLQAATLVIEMFAILYGIEWTRRVGVSSSARMRRTINVLFRISQILALIYGLLSLGYLAIAPEMASSNVPGTFRVRGLEWAIFAPVLGSSILVAAVAMLMVRFTRRDKSESVRLDALAVAAPFLLSGLVVETSLVPIMVTIGLLVFLSGAVRYLIIHNHRGQSMRQFLSPEVARLLSTEGLEHAMRRERRDISVVFCDLRGFTAYARDLPSEDVMSLLERYYRQVGSVATIHGGTVKDHAGDGVLILVGAPLTDLDHARKAARLALALREQVGAFLTQNAPQLSVGIGVATGEATVGAIRGAGRHEYVAVGTVMNLAARLCQRAGAGQVLCDAATAQVLNGGSGLRVEADEPESLKGFAAPVPVFRLSAA